MHVKGNLLNAVMPHGNNLISEGKPPPLLLTNVANEAQFVIPVPASKCVTSLVPTVFDEPIRFTGTFTRLGE